MKITRIHLYPRRRNVAAQVADELKIVTYATPPMEERREIFFLSNTGDRVRVSDKLLFKLFCS